MADWEKVDGSAYFLNVVDPDGWYRACALESGCVDLYRYFNAPIGSNPSEEDTDYLHICDLDDMIRRLQSLRDIIGEHFKEKGD